MDLSRGDNSYYNLHFNKVKFVNSYGKQGGALYIQTGDFEVIDSYFTVDQISNQLIF